MRGDRAGAGEGKAACHLAETWGRGEFCRVLSAAEATAACLPGALLRCYCWRLASRLIGQQAEPRASLLPVQRLEGARPGGGGGGGARETGLLRKPETPEAPRGQIRSPPPPRGRAGLGGVGVAAA